MPGIIARELDYGFAAIASRFTSEFVASQFIRCLALRSSGASPDVTATAATTLPIERAITTVRRFTTVMGTGNLLWALTTAAPVQ